MYRQPARRSRRHRVPSRASPPAPSPSCPSLLFLVFVRDVELLLDFLGYPPDQFLRLAKELLCVEDASDEFLRGGLAGVVVANLLQRRPADAVLEGVEQSLGDVAGDVPLVLVVAPVDRHLYVDA